MLFSKMLSAALVALPLGLAASPASAISFSLLQEGWDEGATVTGIVRGADTDGNRILTESELTVRSLIFSGNSIVPAGPLSFASFSYELDNGALLGDSASEAITGGLNTVLIGALANGSASDCTSLPGTVCGRIFGSSFGFSTTTTQAMVLSRIPDLPSSEVPLPGALGFALAGLSALAVIRRRRQA